MEQQPDGSVRIEIDGEQYKIRVGADGAEHVRMLAAYVNKVMHDVRERAGNVSRDNVAIMAALNIADQMHNERKRYAPTVRTLIQELEKALLPDLGSVPPKQEDDVPS